MGRDAKLQIFHSQNWNDSLLSGQVFPSRFRPIFRWTEESLCGGNIFSGTLFWLLNGMVPHFRQLKANCFRVLMSWKFYLILHPKSPFQNLQGLSVLKLVYGCKGYPCGAIHYAGVKIATGAFCLFLIEMILVDAGEIPLDLSFLSLLLQYLYCFQRLISRIQGYLLVKIAH